MAVALLFLSACGNGEGNTADSSTTASAEPNESTTTASSIPDSTGESGDGIPVTIYFTRDGKVSPAGRSATSSDTVARDALTALLGSPDAQEVGWGLGTTIPEGTSLLGVEIADGVGTVDLSGEFEAAGDSLSISLRTAQVVFTLTQFPTVDRVAVEIEGEPVESIGGEDVLAGSPVTRDSFGDVTPVILVESPLPGATIVSPITVTGSSATFEGTVRIAITDGDGGTVYDSFFTSTGANGVWGPFEETVEFQATAGSGTVSLWEDDVSSDTPGARRNKVDVPVEIG